MFIPGWLRLDSNYAGCGRQSIKYVTDNLPVVVVLPLRVLGL